MKSNSISSSNVLPDKLDFNTAASRDQRAEGNPDAHSEKVSGSDLGLNWTLQKLENSLKMFQHGGGELI